jgi:hypothetical protein
MNCAILVAKELGDNKFRESALDALKALPPPDKRDIEWLTRDFRPLMFPRVSHLKPLLDVYGPRESFVRDLAGMVMKETETALAMLASLKKSGGRLPMFHDILPLPVEEIKKEIPVLRNELKILKDYAPFSVITEYLDCFPENYFTPGGYKRVMKMLYDRQGISFLVDSLVDISKRSSLDTIEPGDFMPFADPFDDIVLEQEQACIDFIKEQWDDLKTASLETLERLCDNITTERYDDGSLLIRLHSLLEYRFGNGEKEVRAMRDRVWNLLAMHAKKSVKKRRRRR